MNKKEGFCIFILLVGIILSLFSWDQIKITYQEQSIYGIYSINEHHALNDVIRILTFIFIPLIFYLISKTIIYKENFFLKLSNAFKLNNDLNKKQNIDFFLLILLLINILLIFFNFLSLEFPMHQMDIYHEGQKTSSSINFLNNNKLWSKNYITVGIIYETIISKLAWGFFNNISLGSVRLFDILLIFIFKIILCYLSYYITCKTELKKNFQYIFFIILSLFTVNLIDYEFPTSDLINLRDVIVIIALILSLKILLSDEKTLFPILILGFMSIFSLLWSLDRGIVCNLLILFSIFYLVINKKYTKVYSIILSIILFWFLTYIFLGKEFNYFIKNSISIITEMSYIHGIIFPKPFSDELNASRATKNLIILIFSSFVLINLYLNKNKFPKDLKLILVFVLFTSFCCLLYIFGRSDGPHIKNVFGISLIFICITLSFYILSNFGDKFLNFINSSTSKYIAIFLLIITHTLIHPIKINNIFSYLKRVDSYVKLEDSIFIQPEYINFINNSKKFVSKNNCIQLFTNDVGLLYLLRAKSCTKYYFVWSVGSKDNQIKMIKELQNANLIISNGKADNWELPLKDKLYLVNQYIQENYTEIANINGFKLLERNY